MATVQDLINDLWGFPPDADVAFVPSAVSSVLGGYSLGFVHLDPENDSLVIVDLDP